jgi:hypothetical protein
MTSNPDSAASNEPNVRTEEPQTEQTCAECGRTIPPGEGIPTETKTFCQPCFEKLQAVLVSAVEQQSQDINYAGAIAGGILGGVIGALVWWGFTVVTHIAFGLVAVLIGIAVGKGVVMLSGGKRAVSLQVISVVIAIICFALASYWVNRSLVLQAWGEQGLEWTLPFIPNPTLLVEIVRLDFGLWDVIFLAIVVWESWKIPKPISLARS